MSRRQYPTVPQVQAAAATAKVVGIERIGALSLSPNGTIIIFDASLARRFATGDDDGAEALADLEARLGSA